MTGPWLNFAVALALGLLIGIDRERRKGSGPGRVAAGLRTFGLSSLLGAAALHVGGPNALLAAMVGVASLAALAYARDRSDDPGMTTEVALLATPLVGALAMSDVVLAGGVGVTIAVVLASRDPVHRFVTATLSGDEITDGLVFAIATVVVWPQLPDSPMGPFGALNPHAVWLFVVLILGIGACGHVLTRVFGPRYGLPLAGLASGLVSSIATIGSMGGLVAKDTGALKPAVAGATMSTVATFAQLSVLLGVTSPPTLAAMAWPLAIGGAVALVYGLVFTALALKSPSTESAPTGRAFSFQAALMLAAMLALMLLGSAWLKDAFGESGIALASAAGGFVDTHATAISVASLAASGKITAAAAVLPILVAMTTNAVTKAATALGTGGRAFGWRVVPGLVLSMGAAWLAALPGLA